MKMKSISKILIPIVFISNLNFNSYSFDLSDNNRYQTFNGSKTMIIDDVLIEDNFEVELEGNTMINLIKDNNDFTAIRLSGSPYVQKTVDLHKPLQANTVYTIAFNVKENLFDHKPFHSIVLGQAETGDTWSQRLVWHTTFKKDNMDKG